MGHRARIAIATVALVMGAGDLSAQAATPGTAMTRAVSGIGIGTQIRLETEGDVRRGMLRGVEPDGALLWESPTDGWMTTAPESVEMLAVRRRAWRHGAIIGGMVGIAGYIVTTILRATTGVLEAIYCGDEGCTRRHHPKVGLASVASLAALGGLVGALYPQWHTVYTAPGVR